MMEQPVMTEEVAPTVVISASSEEAFSCGADAHEDVAVAGYRLVDVLEFEHSR